MRPILLLLPAAFAACVAAAPPAETSSVKPGINDNFTSADLNVDEYVERFEGESREIAHTAGALAAVCGVGPGMEVADVGAGTGLFEPFFSAAAGPSGRVFAVELSDGFLAHLERRAAAEPWSNVEVVRCTETSVGLPRRSVDVAFVCDTYHHFEFPQATLATIRRALRPGGMLVVVDFERIEGVSSEWLLGHVRAGKEVIRAEIEAAGFEFVDEPPVPGMRENYVLRFRR